MHIFSRAAPNTLNDPPLEKPPGTSIVSAYSETCPVLSLPLREYSQRAWKSDFYDFIKNAPLPLFGKGAYAPSLIFGKGAYAPSLIFGKGAYAPSPIGRGHYHMHVLMKPIKTNVR